MCGIAGQVALDPRRRVDPGEVRAMTGALRHRGPDDEGFHFSADGRVGLGMRRLAVIDLDTGRQPVGNEDGTVQCVFNGEIYNFRALRRELEKKGHVFRTASDTEVIVHLYEEEGAACVERLRGMFAFAIHDARDGSVWLARDRLGKKPLYYAVHDGRFLFGSELGALLAVPALPREVDLAALDLYLLHSYVPAPRSIYAGVAKLPPATRLRLHGGRVGAPERYWRLTGTPELSEPLPDLARELRRRLEEAVAIRLESDVPLGCFLSGGVDSSTVVALASRASQEPVRTFSIGFGYERYDELPYARAVAERFGTEHHELRVEADAVAVLPALARHFGEPFGDSSAVPTWYVARIAREHVTVALNGDGGDELFAGYPWYRSALRLEAMAARVPASLARTAAEAALLPERWRRLARRLAASPGERFASLRRTLSPAAAATLYGPELRRVAHEEAERYLVERYAESDGGPLARFQGTDAASYLPEDLLVKVDRTTMAHSLEGRSPLLDHEVAELALRLPAAAQIGPDGAKHLLRRATADLFPAGFFDRPKMGFSIPVAEWLRGALRPLCEERVAGPLLLDRGWLDADRVRALVREHVAGRADWSATLWNLLALAEWVAEVEDAGLDTRAAAVAPLAGGAGA